jgi:molybdopterin/thiamine biosynthesis adenylyltransferase
MFDNIDFQRYNRNIIIDEIKLEGQEKLLNSKVLVAGAGGLGSTVISNMASLGIGNIGIVDNDTVELSNLNRQYIHKFENIGKIKVNSSKDWINCFNPDINVKTYPIRLNLDNCEEIFKDYDLVIDCFDSFASKFVLNEACHKYNKPLIHGGVSEFYGQVMVILPQKTACLNCIFQGANKNANVIKGVISPSVSMIASIQSMEAVKYILGIGNLLTDCFLSFNGLNHQYKRISVPRNPKCEICNGLLVNIPSS